MQSSTHSANGSVLRAFKFFLTMELFHETNRYSSSIELHVSAEGIMNEIQPLITDNHGYGQHE